MDYELENDVAQLAMRGLASAVRSDGTLGDTQRGMLTAVGRYLLGCDTPPDQLEPISPAELATAIPEPPPIPGTSPRLVARSGSPTRCAAGSSPVST